MRIPTFISLRLATGMLAALVGLGATAQKNKTCTQPNGLDEAIEQFCANDGQDYLKISHSVDRVSSPETGKLQKFITIDRFKLDAGKKKKYLDPLIKTFMSNTAQAYSSKVISPETEDNTEFITVSIDDTGQNKIQFPNRKGKSIIGMAFIHPDDPDMRDYYLLRWFTDPKTPELIEGQIYHILSKRPDVINKENRLKDRIYKYWRRIGRKEKMDLLREAMKPKAPSERMLEVMMEEYDRNLHNPPAKLLQFISKNWAEE